MTKARKLYVKSFGCQMNVYDSRRMADTLAPHGYIETGRLKMPISSFSTPATSGKKPPKRSIPSSAACVG